MPVRCFQLKKLVPSRSSDFPMKPKYASLLRKLAAASVLNICAASAARVENL